MNILVTGSAGFIGMHVCKSLLQQGYEIIGLDNLNDYYDVNLKKSRLKILKEFKNFKFYEIDICNQNSLVKIFKEHRFYRVIHLAAQAGVRYSIKNPHTYINSNILGFLNILEESKKYDIDHLVYASSSSVYGSNKIMPFSEDHSVDHPLSLYAASKKSNELMAHTYSHLYGIPTTGLRFFTVYGPWGRPDMALFLFCKAILNNETIDVYNHGDMKRGFTYIDDITEGVINIADKKPTSNPYYHHGDNNDISTSHAPYRIFNNGNPKAYNLMDYISCLENALGIEAKKNYLEIQPGDVKSTSADTSKLEEWINFKPTKELQSGINEFVEWYRGYYK